MNLKQRSKVWIERDGGVVLSDWRVTLLETIEREGSLTRAAAAMGVPYRSAWERIRESEERLGLRLVETQSGGEGGGGSTLTEAGRDLVRRYRQFTEGINELVDRRFRESFG